MANTIQREPAPGKLLAELVALTPKLSGRAITEIRAAEMGESWTSVSRVWHFIVHGPLQRKLELPRSVVCEVRGPPRDVGTEKGSSAVQVIVGIATAIGSPAQIPPQWVAEGQAI